VEKPMGLNREQCVRLVEAIQAKPVMNAVGYMNRYRESVLRAQKAIAESRPIGIAFQWFAARYRVPWWLDRSQSGGPINEQCTHYVDMCRFLLGEISEVQAIGRHLADVPAAEASVAIGRGFENALVG